MKARVMHKIHNSGINIFGVIPLCQFSERARAGETCVPRITQFADHPILVELLWVIYCIACGQLLVQVTVKDCLLLYLAEDLNIHSFCNTALSVKYP